MTTTPSGRLEPTPVPSVAVDFNQALLQSREQARAQWADGLAQFQAQMGAVAELSLPAVVQAAAKAFALGFSFSAQKLIHEEQELLRVTLRHRGGGEEYSEALAPEEGSLAWQALTGSLLAGLLGIPVGDSPRIIEPEEVSELCAELVAEVLAAESGLERVVADDEWASTDAPEAAGPVTAAAAADPGLEPLSEGEIEALHRFLGAMPAEARKRFAIAFRHHFQVPREVRTIKDRITQRRHKDFIDAFELELVGAKA
jgi:hypothetical protein